MQEIKIHNIVSKFRTGYWLVQCVQLLGGLGIIALCLYFSFNGVGFDFRNVLFWVGVLLVIAWLFYFLFFIFNELKRITVNHRGIEIYYILIRRKDFIIYGEIENFTTRKRTHRSGAGRTSGYNEMDIHITNNRTISFNEYQFDNYTDIVSAIYHYKKNK